MENSRYFYLISVIDASYFLLKKLVGEPGRAPIVIMIDKATGYDKEQVKQAIDLIKTIIKAKKEIELDYSGDEQALKELRALAKKLSA